MLICLTLRPESIIVQTKLLCTAPMLWLKQTYFRMQQKSVISLIWNQTVYTLMSVSATHEAKHTLPTITEAQKRHLGDKKPQVVKTSTSPLYGHCCFV